MADQWTVSDRALYQILTAYLASLRPSSWYNLDLYTNDHAPAPGDSFSDYTLPTPIQWPGYSAVQLPASAWAAVQVTTHIATTFQPATAEFAFPPGLASFSVFGYVVSDGYGTLQWAESFASPIEVSYPGSVSVQPYLNLGILPVLTDEQTSAMAGFADDDDQDDD